MSALPLALAVALAGAIGLSLGLLGGGGSILAVPVLVYVAGLEAADAIAMSLAVVGATSVIACLYHARAGRVDLRAALSFGVTGALGALLGARLTPLVPASTLLALFALLMVVVGALMLGHPPPLASARHPHAVPLAGLGVGVLTGFLGVGGGFLIVPALVLLARLEMPAAVGTSLAVISVNAAAGLLGHMGGSAELRPGFTLAFTAAAVAGALAGSRLVGRVGARGLRRAFALLVILVGLALLVGNLPWR